MATLTFFCGVGARKLQTHPILGNVRLASIGGVTSAITAIALVLVPIAALSLIREVVGLRLLRPAAGRAFTAAASLRGTASFIYDSLNFFLDGENEIGNEFTLGAVIVNSTEWFLEQQGYATASTISWTYSQVLQEVHVRVTHQQKQSHCKKHGGNYEDQSRHKYLGRCVFLQTASWKQAENKRRSISSTLAFMDEHWELQMRGNQRKLRGITLVPTIRKLTKENRGTTRKSEGERETR